MDDKLTDRTDGWMDSCTDKLVDGFINGLVNASLCSPDLLSPIRVGLFRSCWSLEIMTWHHNFIIYLGYISLNLLWSYADVKYDRDLWSLPQLALRLLAQLLKCPFQFHENIEHVIRLCIVKLKDDIVNLDFNQAETW